MFKIYTKTGDAGETALFGGRRVSKADLRVEAYGTADELNSFIGLLHAELSRATGAAAHLEQCLTVTLPAIQNRLFSLGAHLASDPDKAPTPPDLRQEDIELLEKDIDQMESHLPPLKNFILPGGHPLVAQTHVCRTICRRAERLVVALHQHQPVADLAIQYLNRLSDYCFVLARYIGHVLQVEEVIWKTRGK